jgi:hypothetical protein
MHIEARGNIFVLSLTVKVNKYRDFFDPFRIRIRNRNLLDSQPLDYDYQLMPDYEYE